MQIQNSSKMYRSMVDCAKYVYRNEGLGAFYISYPTTLSMTVPFTALQFLAYESISTAMNPEKTKLSEDFKANMRRGMSVIDQAFSSKSWKSKGGLLEGVKDEVADAARWRVKDWFMNWLKAHPDAKGEEVDQFLLGQGFAGLPTTPEEKQRQANDAVVGSAFFKQKQTPRYIDSLSKSLEPALNEFR